MSQAIAVHVKRNDYFKFTLVINWRIFVIKQTMDKILVAKNENTENGKREREKWIKSSRSLLENR